MKLWELIRSKLDAKRPPLPEDVEHQMRLATGALLMEMVRADFEIKQEERQSLADIIRTSFELNLEETRQLIQSVTEETECSVSVRIYTSLINEHATQDQKLKLISDLWETAYADGELHALEGHLINRVANAIGISQRDLETLRLTVIQS